MPEEIDRLISDQLITINPMRKLSSVALVSSPDFKRLLGVRGAASGWVGETDARTETNTPALGEVAPTFGTVYAYPKATEESLNDIFFNVEDWLQSNVVDEFNLQEGVAFVSGNGTKKPTGYLNATPSSAGDGDSPARTYPALQYLPTGDASGFGSLSTSSPEFYPADCLVDLIYSVKSAYRARGVFAMNSATAGAIRKLRDGEGRFIWSDSLAAGQPARLLGFPVILNEQMPDVGANAYPVAFGDFERGYLICEHGGLRITVDDNITTPGKIRWYVRRRIGGTTLDNNAVKLLKVATS